jgi:hypothetical protein
MRGETIKFPVPRKKKLGTIADRTKGVPLNELNVTQYASEQLASRVSKLERAHNANGKELKEARIQLNLQGIAIKRLQDRVERSDGE